ncbi:hypothetical protein PUN28_000739 [Cardiocondyla obscurior]|uniref:Uncharacterized protein n=1 Tax=Cardiocondyla obscurior TaxID=286306 RepID=A0AAW2H0U0_9HYME
MRGETAFHRGGKSRRRKNAFIPFRKRGTPRAHALSFSPLRPLSSRYCRVDDFAPRPSHYSELRHTRRRAALLRIRPRSVSPSRRRGTFSGPTRKRNGTRAPAGGEVPTTFSLSFFLDPYTCASELFLDVLRQLGPS